MSLASASPNVPPVVSVRGSKAGARNRTTGARLPPHDGITLLRAATCLSIVVAHLQPGGDTAWPAFLPFQATAGWFVSHPRPGFESFFVLAGYFLAHSFRAGRWQSLSVFGFLRRRVVRLLLPYWLILGISWVGVAVYSARHGGNVTWSPPGFWRQVLLLHNSEVMDLVAPQLWFMAPLFQFYVIWGAVYWGAKRLTGGAHAMALRFLAALALVTFIVSALADAYRGGLDYTLLTNAHYLILGCLVYWYTNHQMGFAWLAPVLAMEIANGLSTNQSRPLAAVATSFLLVLSADLVYSAKPPLAWVKVIGRCSYSIYLTHMFVGWRAMSLFATIVGANYWGETAAMWFAGVLGCVVAGYGFHRLVERPCARWAGAIEYRN